MKASSVIAPAIFYSPAVIILQTGWIVLFVAGTVMLFIVNWIAGIVAIPVYWFVLPILITPSMKKYMLGSWDDNKYILEERGYTEDNYLSGDWWKEDELKRN